MTDRPTILDTPISNHEELARKIIATISENRYIRNAILDGIEEIDGNLRLRGGALRKIYEAARKVKA